MSDISYIQVQQGMKILELENALTAEKSVVDELRSRVTELEALQETLANLEREKERQRLDLLAAQRTAQLAETALEKTEREIPTLKSKLIESEKERKLLKGLNPEKLKKNLIEQKRKTEEAKAATEEWKKRTKEARDAHKFEVSDLHRIVLQMLEERDFFAELDGYRLTLSRFRFPTDPEKGKAQMRIRVTNTETSESCVVFDVSEDGTIQLPTGTTLPDAVADRVRTEWNSLKETGKVTAESSDNFDINFGSLANV